IKEGGRAGMAIRGKYLSGVLVVIEMTLAVVLLSGAGLMIRSFLVAYARPVWVDTSNILTMRLELPEAKYGKPAEQLEFQRRLASCGPTRTRSAGACVTSGIPAQPNGSRWLASCPITSSPARGPSPRPSPSFHSAMPRAHGWRCSRAPASTPLP